jgi:flagellar basal-body rod protein FlgC
MPMFGSLQTAQSALTTYRTWLDAISDNLANINTAKRTDQNAFQPLSIVQNEIVGPDEIGSGVTVARIVAGDPEGIITYSPDHPLADAKGLIRMPNIDMSEQMTNMIISQRSYQANLSVVERARDLYQQALGIGK